MELAASQTGEGEMVVESQHSPRVVEGLDVVTRRGVVGAPVDVLHHVKVGRNVWDVTSLVPLQEIIEEVNIPEGPGDLTARGRHQVLHQVGPVGVVGGDDDLVRVEEGDVLVPVHVPVETVIVRYDLILSLVDQFALDKEVLQPGQVGLVVWQRDWNDFYLSTAAVI